jgi:hypothetical protein
MRSNAAAPRGYGGNCSQPSYKRKGKEMGKTIRASLLVLLLACSVQAGYMPNGSPEPPPQPASVVEAPTANGWMANEAAESLTQITLDLLAVLPSLL